MPATELLRILIVSLEDNDDISNADRRRIMQPLEDAAMAEVIATPSRGGWEALLEQYVTLGVINVQERFYRTESVREARTLWRAYGRTEDHQEEDYLALWTERNETIPEWKVDIIRA